MSWAEHADFFVKNIDKYAYAFRQLREILSENEIKMVLNIFSLFSFKNIVDQY